MRKASAQRNPRGDADDAAHQALDHALRQELPREYRVCVAPIARRIPISLVRSVTLTSMTFMITMPPTTAEIELTMMKTAKNAELMLFHSAMKLSLVPMKKSSSAFGRDVAARAHDQAGLVLRILERQWTRRLHVDGDAGAGAAHAQVSIHAER